MDAEGQAKDGDGTYEEDTGHLVGEGARVGVPVANREPTISLLKHIRSSWAFRNVQWLVSH